jgi:hypothetical protein
VGAARPHLHARHCAWFWLWALVGVGGALGAVSLGWLSLLPAAVAAAAMAHRPSARRSAYGLLTGAGLLLLFVAYVNRHGPGTTCYQHDTATGCDEHLNPLPWLVAGVVLVVGGVVAQARRT